MRSSRLNRSNKRKPREFAGWINEPELISFLTVRLEMNSSKREDAVTRQSINEASSYLGRVPAVASQGFAAARLENSLNDWQFLNQG
jgi:hypothetical protein